MDAFATLAMTDNFPPGIPGCVQRRPGMPEQE
jgi:hypothetical protein